MIWLDDALPWQSVLSSQVDHTRIYPSRDHCKFFLTKALWERLRTRINDGRPCSEHLLSTISNYHCHLDGSLSLIPTATSGIFYGSPNLEPTFSILPSGLSLRGVAVQASESLLSMLLPPEQRYRQYTQTHSFPNESSSSNLFCSFTTPLLYSSSPLSFFFFTSTSRAVIRPLVFLFFCFWFFLHVVSFSLSVQFNIMKSSKTSSKKWDDIETRRAERLIFAPCLPTLSYHHHYEID